MADEQATVEDPLDLPVQDWKEVGRRTLAEVKDDQLVLLAAGVAFFGLLALVPGLVAVVSVYGIVADPADAQRHVTDLLGTAPAEVREFVERQLEGVTSGTTGAASLGALFGLLVALWSASSGMKHLLGALNAVYDETETRTWLRARALSVVFTIGAVAFVLTAVGVIAVVPRLVPGPVALVRWPLLGGAYLVGLAVLYRYGPSRDDAEWRWITPGAVLSMVLWLLASGGFSIYVSNFGSYDETYGSLGGVVVVMLWLFLTTAVVLFGAELNSELEQEADERSEPARPPELS